jgi:hypothetical protein
MHGNQSENPPALPQMMFGDGTPRKALLTALIVGTILIIINHGDYIIQGNWPPVTKILLTYCVPYCVTTWGAILGKRAQWKRDLAVSYSQMHDAVVKY